MAERTHRVLWLWVAAAGALLALIALLMPAHIAAVDSREIEVVGLNSPTLADAAHARLKQACPGSAQLLLAAAESAQIPDLIGLRGSITDTLISHPDWRLWGGPAPLLQHVLGSGESRNGASPPIMEVLLKRSAREELRVTLAESQRPGVAEMLRTVAVTNFTRLPSVATAAGQPVEAATVLAALLIEEEKLAPDLREAWSNAARSALEKGDTATLEMILSDLIALGLRMNWTQLTDITFRVSSPETLHVLATAISENRERLSIFFAAIITYPDAAVLGSYVARHHERAADDMQFALANGITAFRHLVQRGLPIHQAMWRDRLPLDPVVLPLASVVAREARLALALKYFFLFIGLALVVGAGGVMLQLPGAGQSSTAPILRTATFTLIGLAFFIILCEPFLGSDRPNDDFARWELPAAGVVRAVIENEIKAAMDTTTLVALAGFFLAQGVLYAFSLRRLAGIRNQSVSDSVKLHLIDNEEHLFDAGLYVGLGGTVLSLVFLAMGIIKPSLMAAYSSTLFGLIFVGAFKICHLRPFRRNLILQGAEKSAA